MTPALILAAALALQAPAHRVPPTPPGHDPHDPVLARLLEQVQAPPEEGLGKTARAQYDRDIRNAKRQYNARLQYLQARDPLEVDPTKLKDSVSAQHEMVRVTRAQERESERVRAQQAARTQQRQLEQVQEQQFQLQLRQRRYQQDQLFYNQLYQGNGYGVGPTVGPVPFQTPADIIRAQTRPY